jgi:hypothetical protein
MELKRFVQTAAAVCALVALAGCASTGGQLAMQDDVEERGFGPVADMDEYWTTRATYPTGQFSSAWQVEAAEQMRKIPAGTPDGALARTSARSITALDPVNFTPLGPTPLGTGNGVAGRTNVIVTHPTNPAIAWIGSDGGGIWKTTNCCSASTTWTIKTDIPEIANSAIGDMTMDPNNPNVLYAGTGDLRFGSFSFGSNGVLKSVDGGENWTVKGADVFNPFYPPSAGGFPQYQAIGKVVVDPNDSNKVIVGTKTGLFLSYNAGDSWTGPCTTNAFSTQRQDTTGLILRDLGTTTEMIVAIGTRGFETPVQPNLNQNGANGIYRGTVPASGCPTDFALISRPDNGWPAGTGGGTPTPTNTLGRVDIGIAPSNNNVIYAQVARVNSTSPDILGVWRTTDGGNNWTQVFTGTISGSGTQSWYNAGVSVDPDNQDNIVISAFRTHRSTNGGTSYATIASTGVHVDHHARAYVAEPTPNPAAAPLLIGTDGGVFYTSDSLAATPTFTSLNLTLNTIELYSGGLTANFATSASSGAVAGAQDNSCMVSTWTGGVFGPQRWNIRNGGDGIYSTIEPVLGQRWYYSSQNGAIVVTSTAQSTSTQGAAPSGWTGDRISFLAPFDLYRYGGETTGCPAATGCGRIIAGSQRVWESLSGGVPTTSYVANSPDLTKGTLGARSFVNQLSYSVSDPTVAIAGTNDGNVAMGFNMGQGVANSATWAILDGGNTVLPNRPIMDVGTDPANPLIGYAAVGGFDQNTPTTPGHVYQVTCTAQCASFVWRNVSGNLPNIPVNSVIVNPNVRKQVFAGTDWGLFYTNNIDANQVVWTKHAGLPSVMIWDMVIDRGFTTLAVFTRSRGAWVWPLPLLGDEILSDGFE